MDSDFDQLSEGSIVNRLGQSVLLKLGLIGFLTILLLIPSSWIQDLISERQNRQNEVIKEITDKWSGSQLIEGPVLVLPYKTVLSRKDAAGKLSYQEVLSNIYILPEMLNIESSARPELRHRGIFDAVVYTTNIRVKGKFSPLELKKSGINPELIEWEDAKLAIGLSDLKGLKNNPTIKLGDTIYPVEPDFTSLKLFTNNLIALPNLASKKETSLDFNFDLELRGSTELSFLHLGKTTNVKIEGKWKDPSFIGRYLPEHTKLGSGGFNAHWKMPYFNRPFPQQWVDQNTEIRNKNNDASFGVKFILPVDQYQKTMRSAKYAMLIILLTFISLFFTELLVKKKVHLLQYVLIGAAMTIYYTLLLSFSERIGFTIAYIIASVATVTLIGVFIASLLSSRKPALIFSGILSVFYTFIFVLIQLQDLALLFGSVGLFITVATLMFLSSKMDWTKREIRNQD